MLHGAVAGGQPSADFFGIVVERAHTAAIGDAARFIDDVEALWPGGVRVVCRVTHVVDAKGDGIFEALDEIVGNGHPLSQALWLGVAYVVLHIGFHLPLVGGMSFADVDSQKIGVILVVVVNLHHVTDVASKGRSSVAAEDDNERASTGALADVKPIRAIESDEACVRGVVANLEAAAMHVGQGVAHHAVNVLGAARHFAQNEKDREQEHQKNGNRPFPEVSHRELFRPLRSASSRD